MSTNTGKLIVKFAGTETTKDHTEYKIIVKDANNETWQVRARYKALRILYLELKQRYGKEHLPRFPPKKYLFNMGSDFVMQRQKGLENFFNNVLKQYRMDELTNIVNFLYEGKEKKNGAAANGGSHEVGQPNGAPQQRGVSFKPNDVGSKRNDKMKNNKDLEKIIQDYKDQFFDLNDNFDIREDLDNHKKRELIKVNLNVEVETGYKLPKGNETNLIHIHDSTLPSSNTFLRDLVGSTLDHVKKDIDNINFINDAVIIVNV